MENYKDTDKFIEEEMNFRKKNNLPPYAKVVSLIFNYKNKRYIDKFIKQNTKLWPEFSNFQEIKKGNKYVYYWLLPWQGEGSSMYEVLRQFGDLVVSDTIIEQSISSKT